MRWLLNFDDHCIRKGELFTTSKRLVWAIGDPATSIGLWLLIGVGFPWVYQLGALLSH
jgi:hypothetical protein